MSNKIILERKYYGDNITDIEEDVYDAINNAELLVDRHWFIEGEFSLLLQWSGEENDTNRKIEK